MRYLTLAIPNREVRYIFREKIMAWFNQKMKERDFTRLHTAFVSKDTQTLQEEDGQGQVRPLCKARVTPERGVYRGV